MPYFICPNCQDRSLDHDGREGCSTRRPACRRCGFGFLFELMDDYYPAPGAGFVVCDRDARVLAIGKGVFELTGYREPELIGRDLVEALGLRGSDGVENPSRSRSSGACDASASGSRSAPGPGSTRRVTADFFPAYDEDGGLLVALSPR